MNNSQPNQNDEDLVNRNQQIAPPGNPPPPPSSPPPEPPKENLGVGTPNIGVEKDAPTAAPTPTIDVEEQDGATEPPSPPPPPPPPPSPPPPPAQAPPPAEMQPVQIKNYQNAPPDAPANPAPSAAPAPQPPIKAPNPNTGLAVGIVIALVIGSASGFFGFRYFEKSKTSASTQPETQATSKTSSSSNPDVSTWKSYTSELYQFSVKYPSDWQVDSTDPQAETLTIASDKSSLEEELTGYKIEIVAQDSNGKTLKSWVEANTAAIGETKKAKEITVSGQTAFQQEQSNNGAKVVTYLERPSKVISVTYSATQDKFGEGGDWYNNLINSIQLN